jgi:hypothetical protein
VVRVKKFISQSVQRVMLLRAKLNFNLKIETINSELEINLSYTSTFYGQRGCSTKCIRPGLVII